MRSLFRVLTTPLRAVGELVKGITTPGSRTGRLRDGYSRWIGRRHGAPTSQTASTLEVQSWVLTRFEKALTDLIEPFNKLAARINVIDDELAKIRPQRRECERGLRQLYARTVGKPELRQRIQKWPWDVLIGIALAVDWILIRPAMTWAQQATGEAIGPFQLGRDGGALGAALVLLLLAKVGGSAFATDSYPRGSGLRAPTR